MMPDVHLFGLGMLLIHLLQQSIARFANVGR